MTIRSQFLRVATATMLLGAWGVASAQSDPAAGGTVELVPRESAVGTEQAAEPVSEYLPQMEQGAGLVRRQLEEARAARDVVKVLCLNDKLTQLEVVIRSTRDRYAAFLSAQQRGDVQRAGHEYMVLRVLRERARELVAEANQCIGEETGILGESEVTVDVDPMPDPAVYPQDPLVSSPPTLSSPTQ
jgi:hypothetical protein